MKKNPEVDAYISAAPADHQPMLEWLREQIERALPDGEELLESKMPAYKVHGAWATGFASRSKHVMFYVMDSGLLDRYEDQLGKNRSGKACFSMSATRSISEETLKTVASELLKEVSKKHQA